DPITRGEMQREFQQLQKRLKKTMIFVTHDVAEALLFAGRIGLMKQGRLLTLCSSLEFVASDDAEIKSFLDPIKKAVSLLH
ncbi:MAG TPA: ABC transporter ATP-binding protein, partial [Acidobacteriota bacterium]|nr:ABC transporter ATP-binding protein [Acidobacteriota bacterium]